MGGERMTATARHGGDPKSAASPSRPARPDARVRGILAPVAPARDEVVQRTPQPDILPDTASSGAPVVRRQDGGETDGTAPQPEERNGFPWPGMTQDELDNYIDERVTSFAINLVTGRGYFTVSGLDRTIDVPLSWFAETTADILPLVPAEASRADALATANPLQQAAGTRYNVIALYRDSHGLVWPTQINPLTAPRTMSVYARALEAARRDAEATRDAFVALAFWYVGARFPMRTSSGGGGSPPSGGAPRGGAPRPGWSGGGTPAPGGGTAAPRVPAAPAAGAGGAAAGLSQAARTTLSRMSGADAAIMRDAMTRGMNNSGALMDDVFALAEAVRAWRPDAQIHLLGTLDDGTQVFGSLVSGTALTTIEGITTVVKFRGGQLIEVLGAFR